MQIQLNIDSEELIENDDRFSKANFGSRKNYAIEIRGDKKIFISTWFKKKL